MDFFLHFPSPNSQVEVRSFKPLCPFRDVVSNRTLIKVQEMVLVYFIAKKIGLLLYWRLPSKNVTTVNGQKRVWRHLWTTHFRYSNLSKEKHFCLKLHVVKKAINVPIFGCLHTTFIRPKCKHRSNVNYHTEAPCSNPRRPGCNGLRVEGCSSVSQRLISCFVEKCDKFIYLKRSFWKRPTRNIQWC